MPKRQVDEVAVEFGPLDALGITRTKKMRIKRNKQVKTKATGPRMEGRVQRCTTPKGAVKQLKAPPKRPPKDERARKKMPDVSNNEHASRPLNNSRTYRRTESEESTRDVEMMPAPVSCPSGSWTFENQT